MSGEFASSHLSTMVMQIWKFIAGCGIYQLTLPDIKSDDIYYFSSCFLTVVDVRRADRCFRKILLDEMPVERQLLYYITRSSRLASNRRRYVNYIFFYTYYVTLLLICFSLNPTEDLFVPSKETLRTRKRETVFQRFRSDIRRRRFTRVEGGFESSVIRG